MFGNNFKLLHRFLRTSSIRQNYQWMLPKGYDSSVLLYNPITKSKEPLVLKNNSYLTWYSCGPTVYDETHIGHASSYVRLDIIQRILYYWFGIRSIVALGVTDIDDKIIIKSKDLNVDYRVLAMKYEKEYFQAMEDLSVMQPQFILRVSEHIPEIIRFVESIVKSGNAYALPNGNVYFASKSLSTYGKVTRAPVLSDTLPSKEGERRHPADFALWKAAKPNEPSWSSPWGPGRPGWHIECSAMASKIFGKSLDVHTGGLDLAFPHHENEEAQSCAYHSTDQWVNYWIHTGHLLMNGMKMSKSMKNFIPVSNFLKEFSADQFRMLCIMTHYRSSIDYKDDVMLKAVAVLKKFDTFLIDANNYCKGSWNRGNVSGADLLQSLESTKKNIHEFLRNDINTAQCVNHMEELIKLTSVMLHADPVNGGARDVSEVAAVAQFVRQFLQSFGLLQTTKLLQNTTDQSFDHVIDSALNFRHEVRLIAKVSGDKGFRSKLLGACDALRREFQVAGVDVKDNSKEKSSWSYFK